MATDLTLNGGISAGGDLNLGGAIATTGNITGNVVTAVGNVQGVDGVFSGDVSGTSGNFNVVTAVGNVQGVDGVFSGDVSGTSGNFSAGVGNSYCKITAEGGLAIQVTNKTGALSVQGTIVSIKSGVDMCAELTPVDATHCLGVVYNAGVPDNEYMWVVIAGLADVLMKNASTAGHICRIPLTADDGEAAGYAMDAVQSSTASVYKIGDVLETAGAEVLCRVLLSRY